MNIKRILALVTEQVSDISAARIDDLGAGIFAFHCQRDGMARCVQFTVEGIYGVSVWIRCSQSDEALAMLIAAEVRK